MALRQSAHSFASPEATTGLIMGKDYLLLKRASASRPSGQWNDDDFDVHVDGFVVGRIFQAKAAR